MPTLLVYLIIGIVALAVGIVGTVIVQKTIARGKAKTIIENATREAEVLKEKKILEAREEELHIKAKAEKAANERLSKVQSAEAKQKQRELQLNQQQSDNQRRKNELDATKANLDA
ncbi:MAG: DUF3552 domain-containing protein, partial [Muribaculaceae bacterium]|nr:DUF3552 domain-containing protein [Muribaculaceae bacterium]